MEYIALLVLALIIGFGIWRARKTDPVDDGPDDNPLKPEVIEQRRRNLEKILFLTQKQSRLTNDEVQRLLSVSDAAATRYLQILESTGRLVQMGERGQQIYYQLPPK